MKAILRSVGIGVVEIEPHPIELVRNENPGSFWILINHLGDVRCKVGFRSRGSNGCIGPP